MRAHHVADLSALAVEFLTAAASNERNPLIMMIRTMDGTHFKAGNKEFGDHKNPRSIALMKSAINELQSQGLVDDINGKGELFEVSDAGYRMVEGSPMIDEASLRYLGRAFDRVQEATILEARTARQQLMAEAARSSSLQSGRLLLMVKEEYVRGVREAASKTTRLAFDATGTNQHEVVSVLEKGLTSLRDALSNDLAHYFKDKCGWAGDLCQRVQDDFINEAVKLIAEYVDDFRHGILEGARLTKDPLVSVISSITNSPGAVMQSGVGNVQKVLSAGGTEGLRAALAEFLKSKDVQALSHDDKQSVADLAEVLDDELAKPQPDPSKLARWGRRLVAFAEKVGISAAASVLAKALFD